MAHSVKLVKRAFASLGGPKPAKPNSRAISRFLGGFGHGRRRQVGDVLLAQVDDELEQGAEARLPPRPAH